MSKEKKDFIIKDRRIFAGETEDKEGQVAPEEKPDETAEAQKEDQEPKALLKILSELVDYSDYHFRTEDNYMIENSYPLFLSHRKEHLAYIKKVGNLITDFENNAESLSEDLLEFLCGWWQTHISESDLKYARYIKANPKKI